MCLDLERRAEGQGRFLQWLFYMAPNIITCGQKGHLSVPTYLLTYLITYLMSTYLRAYLLTYLLTYKLTYLLT